MDRFQEALGQLVAKIIVSGYIELFPKRTQSSYAAIPGLDLRATLAEPLSDRMANSYRGGRQRRIEVSVQLLSGGRCAPIPPPVCLGSLRPLG